MKNRFISTIIFVAVLFLFFFSNQDYSLSMSKYIFDNNKESTELNKRIENSIYTDSSRKEDKYLVCLWRKSVSDDYIKEKMFEEYHYDMKCFDNDDASSDEIDCYISSYRKVMSDYYRIFNYEFLDYYSIENSDVVYVGEYTGTLILYADKSNIESFFSNKEVQGISPFKISKIESECHIALPQIEADVVAGTGYNSGNGFTGLGVKVGIVEADSGRYDPNAVQLSTIPSTQLSYVDNYYTFDINGNPLDAVTPVITNHATRITSLIVGQSVIDNNLTYVGVVPNATVFQTAAFDSVTILTGINALLNQGVTIINCSAGCASSGSYNALDQEVDNIIYSTKVTFIKSAGNGVYGNYYITSPGLAYNAITVGAARTKEGKITQNYPPYSMASFSCYQEDSVLTNKPDICAPGSFIGCVVGNYNNRYVSGTSYSTALVSGVAAQLQQAKSSLKTNYLALKSILLVGAQYQKMIHTSQSSDNPRLQDELFLYNKSGAGFINAKNSMDVLLVNHNGNNWFELSTAINGTSDYSAWIYLYSNQRIRVVLTYEKADNDNIGMNGYENCLSLNIVDYSNNLVATSSSLYNNVKVLEFCPTVSGFYRIENVLMFHKTYLNQVYMRISFSWIIENTSS